MSKKHFAIIAAAVLFHSSLLAQDSIKTTELEEFIITATKFPLKQNMTGKVIDVITRKELEAAKGKTVSQLLNGRAGLVINGALNNAGSIQTVYMRGAASGRALVLIDGMPAYDPSMINNESDLNLMALNEIEKIEICRCAQSTLYGSDAIAGVINIITINNNVSKPLQFKTTLAGGTQGTFKGNGQLYGSVDKFSYSIKYSKLYTKGFSAAYDSTGAKNFDRDAYNGNNASIQLGYNLNKHMLFRGFVRYNQYKNDIDANAFKDERDFTGRNVNRIAGGSFSYNHDFLKLTANYQYSEVKRRYVDDSSSVEADAFSKYSDNDYYGKSQFAEVYASTGLGAGFTLLTGADYRFTYMNNKYISISKFSPDPYISSFKDTIASQASIYASLNYNAKDSGLNVEVGGRLNVHSRYGSNSTYTFNPSYRFSSHFRVFGTVATSYKAPSLYQLYDGFSGNPQLAPEKSVNYEIGLTQQHQFMTNRFVFFYRDIKNGIDYNYLAFKYFNFFRQLARGFEWELTLKPTDYITVSGNYTYLSIEEQTQDRQTPAKDTAYHYALKRPKHNINGNIDFQVSPSFNFSLNVKYVSNRYDVGGYRVADVLLNGYTLLGAHASYIWNEKLSFFADGQNLTNKKFFEVRGYNAIPFTAIAGISLSL